MAASVACASTSSAFAGAQLNARCGRGRRGADPNPALTLADKCSDPRLGRRRGLIGFPELSGDGPAVAQRPSRCWVHQPGAGAPHPRLVPSWGPRPPLPALPCT